METINHENYVSPEVAKLLKEAGFDWKCNGVFLSEDGTQYAFIKSDAACDNNNSKYNPYNISAPTLDVAQRWLREVKNFDVLILFQWLGDRSITYKYELRLFGRPYDLPEIIFDSYEEAQEAGIKIALEIILEKGE